jgi:cytochrome c biogenesis protein CcmG, thiol:disulfide interchange protein DsbE
MSRQLTHSCRWHGNFVTLGLLVTGMFARADETLPVLKVADETYTNVTVTSVTATDLYFRYPGGMGNAKLKNLSLDLQQHFHFDPAKSRETEQKQRESDAQFHAAIASIKPSTSSPQAEESEPATSIDENGDLVVTKLYARSFRGQRPPQIMVDEWLTRAPEVEGKFVLVVFWASSSEICRQAIPHLNDLAAKFKDRLVIIGLSNELQEEMRKMSSPRVDFYVGTDTQARTMNAVGVVGIPHSLLIDPKGNVRFEGVPAYLDEPALDHLIQRYGK